jgi:hypothetical protein
MLSRPALDANDGATLTWYSTQLSFSSPLIWRATYASVIRNAVTMVCRVRLDDVLSDGSCSRVVPVDQTAPPRACICNAETKIDAISRIDARPVHCDEPPPDGERPVARSLKGCSASAHAERDNGLAAGIRLRRTSRRLVDSARGGLAETRRHALICENVLPMSA